ncbi:PhzF family phenazine biosynthesis protein, partial [Klebsiella pneumoniae]|nr:PhzF family phenazine biosynthesis protein [Klebsiella pneumoniae]
MKYFIVDAFTDKPFGGNPAGVCLLDKWISDSQMQSIAFENGY